MPFQIMPEYILSPSGFKIRLQRDDKEKRIQLVVRSGLTFDATIGVEDFKSFKDLQKKYPGYSFEVFAGNKHHDYTKTFSIEEVEASPILPNKNTGVEFYLLTLGEPLARSDGDGNGKAGKPFYGHISDRLGVDPNCKLQTLRDRGVVLVTLEMVDGEKIGPLELL